MEMRYQHLCIWHVRRGFMSIITSKLDHWMLWWVFCLLFSMVQDFHLCPLNQYFLCLYDSLTKVDSADKGIVSDKQQPNHNECGLRYVLQQFRVYQRCIMLLPKWRARPWYCFCSVSSELRKCGAQWHLWQSHKHCEWGHLKIQHCISWNFNGGCTYVMSWNMHQ